MKRNSPRQRKSRKRKTKDATAGLPPVNPNAAGIDCGSERHFVSVPPDRDEAPVRSFRSFTNDLRRLADWLTACGIETVAMESTGVYWIPLFEILEERGFEVLLVNARHVRNVPGRKSDVSDCQWIQQLHSVGLLRGSFRPKAGIVTLRSYLRHRETLVQTAATLVQRMQKALVQMNVQLHTVISDVTGVTGLAILRDIVAGQTDPKRLARHRDYRCRASEEEITEALVGRYQPEYVFVLRQQLELYDDVQEKIRACDAATEAHLTELVAQTPLPSAPLPPPRTKRKPRDNAPRFDVRSLLHQLAGVDLSQIEGIAPHAALKLLSEIGTDMSRWPTEKHFTSWLTLAPRNKTSGGRVLSSKTQPSANRAAGTLRLVAVSVGRTQTALGDFYRRVAFRRGAPRAVTATARKIALLLYRSLRDGQVYADPGPEAYQEQQRTRMLRRLRKRAKSFGLELLDTQTGEVFNGAVS